MKKTISTIIIINILIAIIIAGSLTTTAGKKNSKILNELEPTPIFSNRTIIYGQVYELTFGEGPIPSANATVSCIGIGLNNKKHPFNEKTTTDENGNYSFGSEDNLTVPIPGVYILYVEKEGYIPSPIYLFCGFAIVIKFITDGFFHDVSAILPVWPPLILIPNIFGTTTSPPKLLRR